MYDWQLKVVVNISLRCADEVGMGVLMKQFRRTS